MFIVRLKPPAFNQFSLNELVAASESMPRTGINLLLNTYIKYRKIRVIQKNIIINLEQFGGPKTCSSGSSRKSMTLTANLKSFE